MRKKETRENITRKWIEKVMRESIIREWRLIIDHYSLINFHGLWVI